MSPRGAISIAIDALRMFVTILCIPTLGFAAIIGFAAYSDLSSRGCFADEAMQCADARTTLFYAAALAVCGPLIVLALTVLRKRVAAREGINHA